MKDTKLILIEGLSGSGKSTLAQFLTRAFTNQGIPCQWWYEEQKDHPLYIFHDQQSLQNVIDALSSGRYQQIIEAVLEQWQAFSQEAQSSEKITIIDGSLFGYLTWSLFPLDIPAAVYLCPCSPTTMFPRRRSLTSPPLTDCVGCNGCLSLSVSDRQHPPFHLSSNVAQPASSFPLRNSYRADAPQPIVLDAMAVYLCFFPSTQLLSGSSVFVGTGW